MPLSAQSFSKLHTISNPPLRILPTQAELLKTLSDILVHGGNSAVARRQAGLQLKNRLMSNDDTVRHAVQERWLQVREDAGNVRFRSTDPPNFLPDTMY